MVQKAVILARGLGTRMRERQEWAKDGVRLSPEAEAIADKGIKAMVPIRGRPFLDYIIQRLLHAHFTELCLVIGPHDEHAIIRHYCERNLQPRLPQGVALRFAVQEQAIGTANAVLAAQEVVGEEEFVVINGDNLYPEAALRALREASPSGCYTVAYHREHLVARSNFEPERVARFAVMEIEPAGQTLLRIIEKPDRPELFLHNGVVWVSMNCFRFTPAIFEACQRIGPSPRGEYELPDAVQYLIDRGVPFRVLFSHEGVLDLTRRHDIATVEDFLQDWRWDF